MRTAAVLLVVVMCWWSLRGLIEGEPMPLVAAGDQGVANAPVAATSVVSGAAPPVRQPLADRVRVVDVDRRPLPDAFVIAYRVERGARSIRPDQVVQRVQADADGFVELSPRDDGAALGVYALGHVPVAWAPEHLGGDVVLSMARTVRFFVGDLQQRPVAGVSVAMAPGRCFLPGFVAALPVPDAGGVEVAVAGVDGVVGFDYLRPDLDHAAVFADPGLVVQVGDRVVLADEALQVERRVGIARVLAAALQFSPDKPDQVRHEANPWSAQWRIDGGAATELEVALHRALPGCWIVTELAADVTAVQERGRLRFRDRTAKTWQTHEVLFERPWPEHAASLWLSRQQLLHIDRDNASDAVLTIDVADRRGNRWCRAAVLASCGQRRVMLTANTAERLLPGDYVLDWGGDWRELAPQLPRTVTLAEGERRTLPVAWDGEMRRARVRIGESIGVMRMAWRSAGQSDWLVRALDDDRAFVGWLPVGAVTVQLLDDLGVRGERVLAVTSSWPGDEQAFELSFAGG